MVTTVLHLVDVSPRMPPCSPGMRMVFKSLLLSMSAMGNVSLVCLMFFAIFAILGTQLFMGLFWR
jgi:hypothetical protein